MEESRAPSKTIPLIEEVATVEEILEEKPKPSTVIIEEVTTTEDITEEETTPRIEDVVEEELTETITEETRKPTEKLQSKVEESLLQTQTLDFEDEKVSVLHAVVNRTHCRIRIACSSNETH